MQEENREGISGALKTLAAVVIVFLLLAALYVSYQAMQVLFPPNTYETALLATVSINFSNTLFNHTSYKRCCSNNQRKYRTGNTQ